MQFVARINPLGRVATEKVNIKFQTAYFSRIGTQSSSVQPGYTVDLVDYNIAPFKNAAHGFRSAENWWGLAFYIRQPEWER